MILITGGLGFIGVNTTQALLAAGEECVLTQYHSTTIPSSFKDYIGSRIFIEKIDVSQSEQLLALGKKYTITGIIHLAGALSLGKNALELFDGLQDSMKGLANVLHAAAEWEVKRVTIASSIGVYNGVTDTLLREDAPLRMSANFPMEASKKSNELLAGYISSLTKVECIIMRFAGMYGPYSRSMTMLPARLIHAAVRGTKPDLASIRFGSIHAQDGYDMCYIKDGAYAIALLQMAKKLNYSVYNVGSGHPTSNQNIVDAIKKVIPQASIELPPGNAPGNAKLLPYEDISRLHEDTGFVPQFTTEKAVADYINWLQAGNNY